VKGDGVLIVNKPAGPTSHDVVAVVRRAIGIDRIGHTGTLDPLATGVLALVMGKATRLASFLSGTEKEYVAGVRLGATTDTYDAEGAGARATGGIPPDEPSVVASALAAFVGTYFQQPPAFSAKKISGTPAYKLARQRKPVDVKPAEVTVRELELLGYSGGLARLRIVCSSGFYVRSLAHDLGERLGCGGFLEDLERTISGDFRLDDARALDEIVTAGSAARDWIIPMQALLEELPAATLTAEGVRRAGHGNTLRDDDIAEWRGWRQAPGRVRLLDESGTLIGIGEPRAGGVLHPAIVLV
jgi:tRNA pseudouridine55 synthase